MSWVTLYVVGLYVAMAIAAIAWTSWVWYVRRRCRTCGRARALRRVPGTRRGGFVRLRCSHCGAQHWSVIDGEGGGGSRGPHVLGRIASREGRFCIGTRAFRLP
ncbi:MAG: hypothetical protein ACYTG3_09260 [Planctomycetota bacterium]|jgi:hypothetical protein